jgi:DNA-binding winged helix-turn-helix (wHTH) protein/tetratricopeptide (TPR) repeat protein
MRFPPFRLDVVNQCLWQGDTRVSLMPKPFAVLRYLVEHAGRLVTQDELLTAIWPDTFVQPEILRRYILEIRRVLGDDAEAPRFIETLPRRGYQFIAPVRNDNVVDLAATVTSASKLVGRESVLLELDGYLRNTLRGQRQLVFVVGEPGIGKTSLVDAFQRACATIDGVAVARGQSVEGFGGKEAYYPILEALGQLARSPSGSLVINTLTTTAPTWLIQFPSLIRTEQQATLRREILGATRDRMVRELCEALEIITQKLALVIVLEDLHWVDHSTLDVISAIARRREPAKLLMLGTFRPADLIVSESPLKMLWHDLMLHRLSHEVELERLRESDVANYLATEFAEGELPPGLATVIHRHSDGNPLFMTAMLDHLAHRGVLTQANGHWTITVPLDEIQPGVPETLRQMLEMQLQHASDTDQRLLESASVAGQHFTAWAVASMLAIESTNVEEQCDALVGRDQFVKASGSRALTGDLVTPEYQFRHALYREVLYRRLNPRQRTGLHRSLAIALEALRSPFESEMAAEIASHFEEGRDHDRAIRHLIVAAQNATRRYAYPEAIAALEHARGLLPRVADAPQQELELQLLERIGNARYAQGDMAQSAASYDAMATRAAEAGLLAAQATALMRSTHSAELIPFFLRAVTIDPDFAFGYTSLSRIYSNLGEAEPAKEYAKLAYERRDRVTERERLSITYQFHFEVTGDQSEATRTLEEWKHAFPSEFQPVNSLALIHNFLGRFEAAVVEGLEAVKRNPSHGFPYSNLSHAYRGLGRFDDARQTAERAVALNVETLPTRRLLYQLAVLAGDRETAARHIDWARDKPREFDMVGARAQALGWAGRVRQARQHYEEAARMAEHRNLADVGTNHLAWATWLELAYGNTKTAAMEARRVLARNPSYDPRLRAALTLASTGSAQEAETIANELARLNPNHTLINLVLGPIVRAGIELARRRPEQAIEQLQVVAPYELGFIAGLAPIYLRAQSYLMLDSALAAGAEFQRILDHRGSDPFSPFHALAILGLARSHARAENATTALSCYERFLAGWAEADSDVPVLLEARHEYDRLAASVQGFKRQKASAPANATKRRGREHTQRTRRRLRR